MYTQCPECQNAFRVSARILQQARGRVHCADCGHAFSALDHLSETMPESTGDHLDLAPADEFSGDATVDDSPDDDKLAETSRRLLETLDELAGTIDVRIEDTGVEWRVLNDDVDESEDASVPPESTDDATTDDRSAAQESLQRASIERRYDDNTPLGDDFDDQDDEYSPPPATSKARTQDSLDWGTPELNEAIGDFTLSEPGDWAGLLDDESDAGVIPLEEEEEEELAAIHNQLSSREANLAPESTPELTPVELDRPAGRDKRFKEPADADDLANNEEQRDSSDEEEDRVWEEEGREPVAEDKDQPRDEDDQATSAEDAALTDETAACDEPVVDDEAGADGFTTDGVLPQTEAEVTVNMEIDAELMAAAADEEQSFAEAFGADVASRMLKDNPAAVETIIMEGEFAHGAIDNGRLAEERDSSNQIVDYGKLADTYALNRVSLRGGQRRYKPASYTVIAGVVVLVLVLIGQVMHGTRESLATYGFFNQTAGPVYRMLGSPITPEWDIKGWQFESTNGSTDENEEVLTISSRLVNKSEKPLPLPLVRLSLMDRWEEIVGSRVLQPNEYLASNLDPGKPVMPGEHFTAVIMIENPSDEATGFKLNVCYRLSPGRVRCAIEDFKN